LTGNSHRRQYCDVTTPFDDPQAELAWMFLQCLCEGGDVDEGFTLLSEDFTFWSIITQVSFDKDTFRHSIDTRSQFLKVNVDLLRCIKEAESVVLEAHVNGTTADGIEYNSPFVCIFETRDGLIVSMREYSDTRAFAEALPNLVER
jgi:uncharacterized protein